KIYQRLVNLSVYLHALQGAVIKQDSILELLLQPQDTVAPAAGGVWRPFWKDGGNREANPGSTIGELALLQRQHSLLQEELLRLRDAESRFKDSERARAKLEKHVRNMKVCSGNTPGSQQQVEQDSQPASLQPGKEDSPRADTLWSSQQPAHRSDGLQDGSDLEVDMTSDDDGTASESSK
ncbi:hypothetical protein FQN60_007634, partial [Etheostoma spectabile]